MFYSCKFFLTLYLLFSHASVKTGIQLGGENEQRVGGLDKNFTISLCMAYFQLLDMRTQELFTELKYLFSLQKSMLKNGEEA